MDDMIRFNELSQKLHSKGVVVLQNDFRLKTPLQEKFISTAKKVSEEYNYEFKILRIDESFNQSDYTKVVTIDTSAVTKELNSIIQYIKEHNNVEIKNLLGFTLEQDLSIFINEVNKHALFYLKFRWTIKNSCDVSWPLLRDLSTWINNC